MKKQKASKTVAYTVRLMESIVTDVASLAEERGVSARTLVRVWIGERIALEKDKLDVSPLSGRDRDVIKRN